MAQDKWIIGTGFSRGIGFELAKIFHEKNYKIIHLGRGQCGFETEFFWWDLINPISDNPIAELSRFLYGKAIHGFIYSAGLMPMLHVSESNRAEKHLFWQSQTEAMRVNYLSCAEMVEDLLPFIMANKEIASTTNPFILNISSLSAVDPFPGLELYGATKNASLQYFKWLSHRFTSSEITCLSVHPGTVDTDMVQNIIKNNPGEMPLVKIYKKAMADSTLLLPKESANKIFKFVSNTELRKSAHGLLYLSDTEEIYKGFK